MSDASRSDLPAPEPSIQSGHLGAPGHQLYWERCGQDSDPAVGFLHHGLGSTQAEIRASSLRACGELRPLTVD
jgi:hypothetical protein